MIAVGESLSGLSGSGLLLEQRRQWRQQDDIHTGSTLGESSNQRGTDGSNSRRRQGGRRFDNGRWST